MGKDLYIIRHSNRIDLNNNNKHELEEWLKSERHKENKKDPPISSLGKLNTSIMALNLLNHVKDITQIKYFIACPFLRIMETAIGMIDHIYKLTNHKILIRIEYGFGKIDEFKTRIDKRLYPKALKIKYKAYLDPNFEKYLIHDYKNMVAQGTKKKFDIIINTFKKTLEREKKITVIITHATTAGWIHMWSMHNIPKLTMPSDDFEIFGGQKKVGIMTGYRFDKKNINIPAKIIYKTSNKNVIIN